MSCTLCSDHSSSSTKQVKGAGGGLALFFRPASARLETSVIGMPLSDEHFYPSTLRAPLMSSNSCRIVLCEEQEPLKKNTHKKTLTQAQSGIY